jgi:hypothetical protein
MWDTRQAGSEAPTRSRDCGIAIRPELFGCRNGVRQIPLFSLLQPRTYGLS